MRYNAIITIKSGDKEDNIHMEFAKDDVYDVVKAFDTILNFAAGDEVQVFARRWTE